MPSSLLLRGVVELLATGVLLSMLVQDWRWRGIQWPLFPLLAALLLTSRLTQQPVALVVPEIAVNGVFVGIQVLLLAGYTALRFGTSLLRYLGLGDILYWLACTVYFSPVVFLLYHVVSLLAALVLALLARYSLRPDRASHIPLAGFQAAVLIIILVLSWVFPAYWPTTDEAVLAYLI